MHGSVYRVWHQLTSRPSPKRSFSTTPTSSHLMRSLFSYLLPPTPPVSPPATSPPPTSDTNVLLPNADDLFATRLASIHQRASVADWIAWVNPFSSSSAPLSPNSGTPPPTPQGSASRYGHTTPYHHQQAIRWGKPAPFLSGTACPRNIVLIGLHGWFPSKWISLVVGEATGTSERFIANAEMAVRSQLKEQFPKLYSEEATSFYNVPLVHHSKILQRAEQHKKQLLPHLEKMRKADLVLVVTHSQGCPTAFLLLADLIQNNLITISNRQRVGMLCMAGIHHGPFKWLGNHLVVKWGEGEAAHELFDMARVGEEEEHLLRHPETASEGKAQIDEEVNITEEPPADMVEEPPTKKSRSTMAAIGHKTASAFSAASHFIKPGKEGNMSDPNGTSMPAQVQHAIRTVLEAGVTVTCVASWRDTLHSALMAAYDHPNLVRFIYIDAFNYLDDFVTHLVTVAIRLRNAGVDDRNILWHLSESIVGSIYRGTEHSTIYEGQDVYKVALKHALSPKAVQEVVYHTPVPKHDTMACPDLHASLIALKEEFTAWEPSGVHGRDSIARLKQRLQALSAKL